MASSVVILLLVNAVLLSASSDISLGHEQSVSEIQKKDEGEGELGHHRVLVSFIEAPTGGNLTFECSPTGPCLPCLHSEKNDDKYRCSETGYRIPLRCVKSGAVSKEAESKKTKGRSTLDTTYKNVKAKVMPHDAEEFSTSIKQRNLLDDSSTSESGSDTYITYRSCIPAVNEEKLSVLGFEGIMLCLLVMSSSFIFFRRKGAVAVSGAVRVPTSSRF